MAKDNTIWCEKYRPDTLDDYVGNDHIKEKFSQYIAESDPPHVMLYGKAGTGKTTLARILTNNIDCDELYINASDETGVDIVRTEIKPFAASVSFSKMKIVILDEFDYMSPNSQAALRNIMEQFSKITRFVLTCNYHEKIIEPIISRCQVFEVFPPSRTKVAVHVAGILKKEGVSYKPEDVKLLLDTTYPDIRQLINSCQRNSTKGQLVVNREEIIDSDFKLKMLDILKKSAKQDVYKNIRQLVANNHVSDFTEVFRFLIDRVDEYAPTKSPHITTTVADGLRYDTYIVDKEINFMATMIELIAELPKK